MVIVAVAGGLGDLGRLITDALLATGKYETYIMSRKVAIMFFESYPLVLMDWMQFAEQVPRRTSPLTGKEYDPIIKTDYSSEKVLARELEERNVNVVICTFIMDNDTVSDAQLRLIRAADRSSCVRRFIPSEWNVEYDVSDNVLPYPEKRFHMIARQELEKTSALEYAYVYPGMFMDYFGMPRVPTALRPLCFFVDPAKGLAVLPDDGEAKMSMTVTTDAARYVALALQLDEWPRILSTVASTVSLNELVGLVEKSLGHKLEVRYQPVDRLLKYESLDLPTNLEIAKEYPERFPGGLKQFRALIADLEAGVALGAYDLSNLKGHLDLVKVFEGKAPPPKRIEQLVGEAWRP